MATGQTERRMEQEAAMDPSPTVQPLDPEPTGSIPAALLAHPGFVLALRERRRMATDLGCTCLLDPTRQSGLQMARAGACFLRQAILLRSEEHTSELQSPK